MKHITDPLSAKEIRDALGVTDEDLEAARRAIADTENHVDAEEVFMRLGEFEKAAREYKRARNMFGQYVGSYAALDAAYKKLIDAIDGW